jgi:outer membrane protein W
VKRYAMKSETKTRNIIILGLNLGLAGALFLQPSFSWAGGNDIGDPSPTKASSPYSITGQSEGLAASDQQLSVETSSDDSFHDRYLKGRLQIGTRSAHRILTNADSGAMGKGQGEGTYLGSIYALSDEQNLLPIQPFLTYYFTRYMGLELAYDSFEAKTLAYNGAIKTDGKIDIKGPTLTLLGRYPNQTSFTPYAGIGLGFFSTHFDADPAWALGYADTAEWSSYGYPKTSVDGYYRYMFLDNIVSVLLTAGVSWNIYGNWSLDLSAEYIKANVDATFRSYSYGVNFINEPGSFPMSNVSLRTGISYTF